MSPAQIIWQFLLVALVVVNPPMHATKRILHITYHNGCAREINYVAQQLGVEMTTWYTWQMPPHFLDDQVDKKNSLSLYNISHKRAERIWNKHKKTFESFDAILVSDTAPLARIFLQNNFSKPLIIWICNRFDYANKHGLDCKFPDQEYYDLFQQATNNPLVKITSYAPFECEYAKMKNVIIPKSYIRPIGKNIAHEYIHMRPDLMTARPIPKSINKKTSFFIPPYGNNNLFRVEARCHSLGIPCYRGNYEGPDDLRNFKGIINIPHTFTPMSLYEIIQLGIPQFVPSITFIKQLMQNPSYSMPSIQYFEKYWQMIDWYHEELRPAFIYFDSWTDLKEKIRTTNFEQIHKQILELAAQHEQEMLRRWRQMFTDLKIV